MTTDASESTEDRNRRRSRLESEISEILERSNRPPSNVVKFRSQVRKNRYSIRQRAQTADVSSLTTEINILVAAVALAVLGVLIGDASEAAGRLLAILSFAAVVWLFVRYFRRPDHRSIKTWRGRDIDLTPPRRSEWLDRRMGRPRRRS